MEGISLVLPYPPSVNKYWRPVGSRLIRTKAATDYREDVAACVPEHGIEGRLWVALNVHPPDNRRRDIDNVQKAVFDALGAAGVYEDDSQIDTILIRRCPKVDGGEVTVEIHNDERGFWCEIVRLISLRVARLGGKAFQCSSDLIERIEQCP